MQTYAEFKAGVGATGTYDTASEADTNLFGDDHTITTLTDAPVLSDSREEADVQIGLDGGGNEDISPPLVIIFWD